MEIMSWYDNFGATLAGTSAIDIIMNLIAEGNYDFNWYAVYVLSNLSSNVIYKQRLINNSDILEKYILPFLSPLMPESIQINVLKLLGKSKLKNCSKSESILLKLLKKYKLNF